MSYLCIKTIVRKNKKLPAKKYLMVYEVEGFKKKVGKRVKVMQKTKRFIGPYHPISHKKNTQYPLFEIIGMDYKEAVKEVVKANLLSCGFAANKNVFTLNDFTVDLDRKRVLHQNKGAVLGINAGYVCEQTLRELYSFKLSGPRDIKNFVKIIKTAGLLDFESDCFDLEGPETNKDNVYFLIKKIEEIIEKKDKQQLKRASISQNNILIMKLLLKKQRGFHDIIDFGFGFEKEKMKTISVDEFKQKHGW